MATRGKTLGNVLNSLIDGMVDDDTERADVIASMGSAAGIEPGTVNGIVSGEINCPPLARLRAFARVLGTSIGRLRNAAESDGCEYEGDRTIACGMERRYCDDKEFRVGGDDAAPTLIGHAAVFNTPSQDLGGFTEIIAPGAFTRTLAAGADIRALLNHDPNYVIGRSAAGTARYTQDDIGLRYEIDVDPTNQRIMDAAYRPAKRGDISQSSFGFQVVNGGATWTLDDSGRDVRTIHEAKLYDGGPVTFPAYNEADAGIRSASLAGIGINWDAVSIAIRRTTAGAEMRNEDRAAITAALERLGTMIPVADPLQDGHSDKEDIGALRMRLKLKELED